jgi:hypothetical protein
MGSIENHYSAIQQLQRHHMSLGANLTKTLQSSGHYKFCGEPGMQNHLNLWGWPYTGTLNVDQLAGNQSCDNFLSCKYTSSTQILFAECEQRLFPFCNILYKSAQKASIELFSNMEWCWNSNLDGYKGNSFYWVVGIPVMIKLVVINCFFSEKIEVHKKSSEPNSINHLPEINNNLSKFRF